MRAVGGSAEEAFQLFRKFKALEEAGGVLVEAEVIPGAVMAEISARTGIITVSLGSGGGADVDYLFMEDICGDVEKPPRHARAFGNMRGLRQQLHAERIGALKAFRGAAENGEFPGDAETAGIPEDELDRFRERLESSG